MLGPYRQASWSVEDLGSQLQATAPCRPDCVLVKVFGEFATLEQVILKPAVVPSLVVPTKWRQRFPRREADCSRGSYSISGVVDELPCSYQGLRGLLGGGKGPVGGRSFMRFRTKTEGMDSSSCVASGIKSQISAHFRSFPLIPSHVAGICEGVLRSP